jgi:hypothetical protein
MWTCPSCGQHFVNKNQLHSCKDKTLGDFLAGKSEHATALFWQFVRVYQERHPVTIHPTKSMVAIAAKTRIAYITRIGRDFVDITFPFDKAYAENLCFHKIARVPGTDQYNHHFRLMAKQDLNKEILGYMKLAYQRGK